jgi:hypothetical protein
MAYQHLRTLQLDPNKVEAAADFFEAYASYILSQIPRDAVGQVSLVDAATSLRSAGQWAMFFDPQRATDLLIRSAEIWDGMGYGFGTFVLAAMAPSRLNRYEMISRLTQIAQLYDPSGAARQFGIEQQQTLEPLEPLEPLLHPQQQAYLLLAGASMWRRLELPLDILRIVGNQSPHRRGVAPTGALGTPLRVYWNIAREFLGDDDEQTAALVARDLAGMGTAYAQTIDSAMANERLWFNAAAPVDVGDIDTVTIALTAAQRLGPELTRVHLQSAMEGLEATARVPLELATEMIDINLSGPDDEAGSVRG